MRGLSLLVVALLGCTGVVDGPGSRDDTTPGTDPTGRPVPPGGGGAVPVRPEVCGGTDGEDLRGPRLLRRLTGTELEASVRDVFELGPSAWSGPSVPPDPASPDGLTNNADLLRVNDTYAAQLRESAEDVGNILAGRERCTEGAACVEAYLDRYGRRAYRRPLTEAERDRFRTLFQTVENDYSSFVRWATAAMIQSPHFLYRREIGSPNGQGTARLDAYEIATAMAYTLTGSTPDDALLDAAAAGVLDEPEGRRQYAATLAFDASGAALPRFRAQVQAFARAWLGLAALDNLGKKADLYPTWSPAVREAMRVEVEAYIDRVVLDERGSVADLLTNPSTTVDATLASYYGLPAPGNVVRPDGWGIGVLSLGGVLAMGATSIATSPTQRGYFVRTRVMCDEVPPPPPQVGEVPEPTATSTTRQRYEEVHAANASCRGCHRIMDPIGFGFEHLDAAGRYRATENGLPIDASGAIENFDSTIPPIMFDGPNELAELLSSTPAVGECVGSFAAALAFGLDRENSECLASTARRELIAPDKPLVDIYLDLVATVPHSSERSLSF